MAETIYPTTLVLHLPDGSLKMKDFQLHDVPAVGDQVKGSELTDYREWPPLMTVTGRTWMLQFGWQVAVLDVVPTEPTETTKVDFGTEGAGWSEVAKAEAAH